MAAIELSFQEIEDYLCDISLGRKIISIDNKYFILKYPSQLDNFYAKTYYKIAHKEALDSGLPLASSMEETIKARNLFSEEDEKKIDDLKAKIVGQKAVLEKTVKVPARRERLIKIINDLELELFKLRRKKDSLLEGTVEARAEEARVLYLCRLNCFHFESGELVWPTKESFENEYSYVFRSLMCMEYKIFLNGIDTKIIRYIARSNIFTIRYLNSLKASSPLFNVPAVEYTTDMLNLSYWANFYRSIYEMMPEDIPPDYVVSDDDALDSYMEAYYSRRKNEREVARATSSTKSNFGSAFDHPDVFVMKSNPIYEDIDYNNPKLGEKNKGKVDLKDKKR